MPSPPTERTAPAALRSGFRRSTGSIVGRSHSVRAVRGALGSSRLVSLVGPGGVGKTALAAEVVHEMEPEFDRVVVVELSDAGGEGDVLRAMAAAIAGDTNADRARLTEALEAVPTLLVVDNCEHLVEEAALELAHVLEVTVDTTVLATSRRPLGLADETIWTIPPLSIPSALDNDDDLVAAESVQLFLERVRQVVPEFELTPINRPLIAAICIAADGLPLAIELAAALVRGQPLDEIVRAIRERPGQVASSRRDRPPHQSSLSDSLEWSRQFLSPADAHLLDRLSIFVGGFTHEAAERVAVGDSVQGLGRLVDHSLVSFDPETGRYRLLEVVRLDSARRLDQAQRLNVEREHLAWCVDVVGRIDAARFDADPDNTFPRWEWELPNLCAALRRCLEQADLDGFRSLLGPIAMWWVHYLAPDNPDEWLTPFQPAETPVGWRGNVESAIAYYWSHRARHDLAAEFAHRAEKLHREAGDEVGRALDLLAIGNAGLAVGDLAAAEAVYRQCLEIAVATRHPYPELAARVNLARLDPDGPEAGEHLRAALVIARQGFGALEAVVNAELGTRALRAGRPAEARRHVDDAVERARTHGYAEALATALCGRGEVAVATGDVDVASADFSEALDIGRRASHQGIRDRAQAGLENLPLAPRKVQETEESLSERELAVARLLRGDLTQREIADELYIAPSTVKTHIKAIYRKLGVSKRSHAITRASELDLF